MTDYTEQLEQFALEGEPVSAVRYGSGHINDTCLVTVSGSAGENKYILQRINTRIFENPQELMENIVRVTDFLRDKIQKRGGDPRRETLNVIPTKANESFYRDSKGECWRMYRFIDGAVSLDQVEKAEDLYQGGLAFGRFQQLLADFPAQTLHETIPDFHNTPKRLADFRRAVEEDICGLAAFVEPEIRFIMEREADTRVLMDMLAAGELPLRVTHNDTKLNNVMIDNQTGEGICVIDLDTVMPGLTCNDFGDSIRFGANHSAEDEKDLSKVNFDLGLFESYTRGFLAGAGGVISEQEKEYLPWGAKLMTLECGMRFLTDYLEGDHYFAVHREGQNLDRCRTQFKLVSDMEKCWEQMKDIICKY